MTLDPAHAVGVIDKPDYGDSDAEYNLIAKSAGLIHLGKMEWVALEGADAVPFLQGLTSQHVPGIPVGEAGDGWLLNAGGKVLYSTTIFRPQPQMLLLQCAPGQARALAAHLDKYLIMEDAVISVMEDWDCYSLQGPAAHTEQANMIPGLHFAHARSQAGGIDFFGDRAQTQPLATACLDKGYGRIGLNAWNRARIEAFLPWFGIDMKADTNPMIYGHLNRCSATKGCYLGQETVAKTRDRGRPPMRLCQIHTAAGDLPAAETPLLNKQHGVGTISSAAVTEDGILALATLKHAIAEKGEPVEDGTGRRWRIEAVKPYKD